MSSFVVTRDMLHYIAIKVMELQIDDELPCDSCPPGKPEVGTWVLGNAFLRVYGTDCIPEQFSFWDTGTDTAACHLLMWLVRNKGWIIDSLGCGDYGCYCSVVPGEYSDEAASALCVPTLYEAILRTILAASGWKEED